VAEQLLYEIHDPAQYILPDVICDFRNLQLWDVTKPTDPSGRVQVTGARGLPPTAFYKASLTYYDDQKIQGMLMIGGFEAAQKAEAVAKAIFSKTRQLLKRLNLPDFDETHFEVLGAEHSYGPHSRARDTREVVLRLVAKHKDPKALMLFAKEFAPAATSMAPGITGAGSGRPQPTPSMLYRSCLIPKDKVPITILVSTSEPIVYVERPSSSKASPHTVPSVPPHTLQLVPNPSERKVTVPLIKLCYGRSGDKGDVANIGIICRKKEHYNFVKGFLTEEVVKQYMKHVIKGTVRRYELVGIAAFNFVCTKSLGGGGLSSLNMDRQGKCYAQMLLDLPVTVPASWLLLQDRNTSAKL
jgi:hypothetical protein